MDKEEIKKLKRPDEFVQLGRKLVEKVLHSGQWVLVMVGTIALVAGAYYGYQWYRERSLDEGWQAYYVAMQVEGDKKWEELPAAYEKLSGRPKQMLAAQLADHYFQKKVDAGLGKQPIVPNAGKLAVEWYQKSLEYSELLPEERQLLLLGLATSQQLEGELDSALANLDKAKALGGPLRALVLFRMGRVLEQKGDNPKAIESYQQVTVEFADTEYAKSAKNFMRYLKSPLFDQKS